MDRLRRRASAEHAAYLSFDHEAGGQGLWAQRTGACGAGRLISEVGVDAVEAVGVALQALLRPLQDVVTDAADIQVWGRDQEEFKGVSRHGC